MEWSKRTAAVQVGDVVAYSKQFLQSTGQYTGDAPQARGTVTGLTALGGTMLAEIEWDKPDLPERVNTKNLSRVKDGRVIERD